MSGMGGFAYGVHGVQHELDLIVGGSAVVQPLCVIKRPRVCLGACCLQKGRHGQSK